MQANGQRATGNGRRATGDGRRATGDGRRAQSTEHRAQSTADEGDRPWAQLARITLRRIGSGGGCAGVRHLRPWLWTPSCVTSCVDIQLLPIALHLKLGAFQGVDARSFISSGPCGIFIARLQPVRLVGRRLGRHAGTHCTENAQDGVVSWFSAGREVA